MDVLSHAIYDTILNAPEHARIVETLGSVAATDRLIQSFVPALTRTLLKKTNECKHVLSLYDADFRLKRLAAIDAGAGWKDRARDRKGQLFRLIFLDGFMHGWSTAMHAWVLVVPQSLQTVVYKWLKYFYAQCNESTKEAFARYETTLERDYATAVCELAMNRGLCDLRRQCLGGRRNKFVRASNTL